MVDGVFKAMECAMKQPQAITAVVQPGSRLEIEQPGDAVERARGIASARMAKGWWKHLQCRRAQAKGPHSS